MGRRDKLLDKILRGTSDANINFNDLCHLLKALSFVERIRGDHHIFSRVGIEEILNLQPKGAQAKAYQVKQVRTVILKYEIADEVSEDNDDEV
ncbi:MAG: type II toxin-antitoxin system HicA family toxin [Acidobacteria bacterium]|nr:type II toxin-antitoxin system HicA family toxin [Acidobacteriota bacterium]